MKKDNLTSIISHSVSGAIGIATGLFVSSLIGSSPLPYPINEITKEEQTPALHCFHQPFPSEDAPYKVTFRDNVPVGMKSFINYNGEEIELELNNQDSMYATFKLPPLVKEAVRFDIYATDRDGNESERVTAHNLDGILFDKNPHI